MELPVHVEARVGQCGDRPTLLFDHQRVAARMREVTAAAARHGAHVYFACKAFPDAEAIALARTHGLGLDVAGPDEWRHAEGFARVSIANPTGEVPAAFARGATVVCESPAQVTTARAAGARAIALRISISSLRTGDAVVGALSGGTGHHRSRFGVELDAGGGDSLTAMIEAAGELDIGLHTHSAGATLTSPQAWAELAQSLMAVGTRLPHGPAFIDVGGGWHGVADRIDETLAAMRAVVPPAIELRLEPGRLWSQDAGFAVGAITQHRALVDRSVCVTTLSRLCHLRWSHVRLCAPPPRADHHRALTLVGATCSEEDWLGDWVVDDERTSLAPGAPVVVAGVSGYAVAWNRGFAGVPVAEVVWV